jgi:pimeloyl-ACP methyl ester carboxylesterase
MSQMLEGLPYVDGVEHRLVDRVLRTRVREGRLTVPLRLLFGAGDLAISKSLLRGYEPHADDMELELVPDSGHFLPDERPELVAERALAFFAGR